MRTTSSLFAVALVSLAAAGSLSAQERIIRVGPTFGVNITKITGDNQEDATTRTGIRAGGFATIGLGGNFALQPELVYTGKGANYPDDEAEIKIGYIQLPVLARLRIPTGQGKAAPYLIAGPAFAFKAGCTIVVEGESMDCDDTSTEVAGSDFGLILGAGLEVGQGRISVRWDQGLKNINADGPAKVKNRSLTIAVGYAFRAGR